MVHNRSAIEQRMQRLAAYLGLETGGFEGVLNWVLELRREFSIPHTAEALGVGNDRFEQLAEMAIVDPTAGGNPLPLSKEDAVALYEMAWRGEV